MVMLLRHRGIYRLKRTWFRRLFGAMIGAIFVAAVMTNIIEALPTSQLSRPSIVENQEVDVHRPPRRLDSSNTTDDKCRDDDEASGYPKDLVMTQPYKDSGNQRYGLVLHIIGIMYMFYGLNEICDVFFVAALEEMCERWEIAEDVAGATFMAAGGSAPEFFTSLMGVFVAESDVGFGTVVGSAVFNVLFVIGLCAVAAGGDLPLTSWPLFRDCMYYLCGLAVLAFTCYDESINWWEALLLFCMYIGYVTIMYFNGDLKKKWYGSEDTAAGDIESADTKVMPVVSNKDHVSGESESNPEKSEEIRKQEKTDEAEAQNSEGRQMEAEDEFQGERKKFDKDSSTLNIKQVTKRRASALGGTLEIKLPEKKDGGGGHENDDDDDDGDPLEWPADSPPLEKLCWIMTIPLVFIMHKSVPDCSQEELKKYFLVTFFMSLVWITILAYFMVWWATVLGAALKIPSTVMGITLLAAGTSIPDALSSIAVAKKGEGDMAVSSSVGSNIFDILVGLPIPWLLSTGIVRPGSTVTIYSSFLVIYVLSLAGMVLLVVLAIYMNRWTLNMTLGRVMFVLYLAYLAETLTLELGPWSSSC